MLTEQFQKHLAESVDYKEIVLGCIDEEVKLLGIWVRNTWFLKVEGYLGPIMSADDDTEEFSLTVTRSVVIKMDEVTGVSYEATKNITILYGKLGPIWMMDDSIHSRELAELLEGVIIGYPDGWVDLKDFPESPNDAS